MALIEPAQIDRLFGHLVKVLAERHPDRLRTPFQVAELYQQIIPYRTFRAQLGFDTNQDYEAAVLGLLAGHGGYVTLEPVEAQEALATEATSSNPDPGLFREYAGARMRLHPAHVKTLLEQDLAYAPPDPAVPPPAVAPVFELERARPTPPADEPAAPPAAASSDAAPCARCGRELPGDRSVVFCPWCGTTVGTATCPRCGEELDPEWRFCPRCGRERRG